MSPVGHAANLHLDLACHNFDIQEAYAFSVALYDVCPDMPELHGGFLWANDRPGLDVETDEAKPARYPIFIQKRRHRN